MKISSIELFINALELIEVTLSGMVRFFIVEFSKAFFPMVSTSELFGITLVLQDETMLFMSVFIRQLPTLLYVRFSSSTVMLSNVSVGNTREPILLTAAGM